MRPRDRNVLNPDVSIVAAPYLNLVYGVKVDDVDLLLLFILLLLVVVQVLLRRSHLEGLEDEEIALWAVDFVQPELPTVRLMGIVVPELAQFAVERSPGVGRHVGGNFFVFAPAQPFPETVEVHVAHRSRTFARLDQRVSLLILVVGIADAAHSLALVAVEAFALGELEVAVRVCDRKLFGFLVKERWVQPGAMAVLDLLSLGLFDLNFTKTQVSFGLVIGDVIDFTLCIDLYDLDNDAADLNRLATLNVKGVLAQVRVLRLTLSLIFLALDLVLVALYFAHNHPELVHFFFRWRQVLLIFLIEDNSLTDALLREHHVTLVENGEDSGSVSSEQSLKFLPLLFVVLALDLGFDEFTVINEEKSIFVRIFNGIRIALVIKLLFLSHVVNIIRGGQSRQSFADNVIKLTRDFA